LRGDDYSGEMCHGKDSATLSDFLALIRSVYITYLPLKTRRVVIIKDLFYP
jgi:hypothetical protein